MPLFDENRDLSCDTEECKYWYDGDCHKETTVGKAPAKQKLHDITDEILVKTPCGYIIVRKKGTELDYPGVFVSYSPDGVIHDSSSIIACVEFDTSSQSFAIEAYSTGDNEPECITHFEHDINESED